MKLKASYIVFIAYAALQLPCGAQGTDSNATTNQAAAEPAPWTQSPADFPMPAPQEFQPQYKPDVSVGTGAYRTSAPAQDGTAYGATRESSQRTPQFSNEDYLNGVGSGRGSLGEFTPQTTAPPQPVAGQLNYNSPFSKGFFDGKVNPNDKMEDLQKFIRIGPLKPPGTPEWWGKDAKPQPVHSYADDQEHYGNEDPYGFLSP